MTTVGHWLAHAARRLCAVDSPRLSAELLLCRATGLNRVQLATWPERELDDEQLHALEILLARREDGEPVAYLLGYREFFGRDFIVTPATLIPRPETELLVQAALDAFPSSPVRFADLGTGSGCIAVTLCAERPHWLGLAADLSADALAVAARNLRTHAPASRLRLVRADFTRPLLAPACLDLLVSNPPYISGTEYETLSVEVRGFEPATALVPQARPEAHGLEHAEAVIRAAAHALRPGGVLLMEHGCTQGPALQVLLENNMWEDACVCNDLAGLDRFVRARRSPYGAGGVC